MNKFLTVTILLTPFFLIAQFYPTDKIDPKLKENAYAVIREANLEINLNSINEFKSTEEVVISVLEKSGDSFVDAHQFYDPNTKIDFFEAEIYDASGKLTRKYKIKELSDASAVSGGQLYTDDRIKYLNFTPVTYPYTVKYKIITTNKNTLFLPRWTPIKYSNLSIENSKYNFNNNTNFTIRSLDKNTKEFNIQKTQNGNNYSYQLKDFKPLQEEDMMRSWRKIIPQVIIASNQINIDGTQGQFDNWKDYGKWSYNNLVKSKLDFSPSQKTYFTELVKDAKSDKEKIDILYQHMQKKVRYIGVQLGIGGLSPFPNTYVENKSYGDCKALSNYMIGMLDAVGIKGYHTILYADENQTDIDTEMMYQQGNHMIVYVPLKDENIWIEATSQTAPLNYLGEMSGNRKVYIFDENGGKIIDSQKFDQQNNILTTKGIIQIKEDGTTDFKLSESAKGIFYENVTSIEKMIEKDKIDLLKRKYSQLSQPTFANISLNNNKAEIDFLIQFEAKSNNYAKKQGNSLIFNLIPINNEVTTVKKAKAREFDFEIQRGYTDIMEFEIHLPPSIKNELILPPLELNSEFGNYELKLEKKNKNIYLLTRIYQQNKGVYDKNKFNDYVEFRRKVAAQDNIKTLIEL